MIGALSAIGKNMSADLLTVKFRIMELAISDIGMGWHQWCLFVLCGLGWAADKYIIPLILCQW